MVCKAFHGPALTCLFIFIFLALHSNLCPDHIKVLTVSSFQHTIVALTYRPCILLTLTLKCPTPILSCRQCLLILLSIAEVSLPPGGFFLAPHRLVEMLSSMLLQHCISLSQHFHYSSACFPFNFSPRSVLSSTVASSHVSMEFLKCGCS